MQETLYLLPVEVTRVAKAAAQGWHEFADPARELSALLGSWEHFLPDPHLDSSRLLANGDQLVRLFSCRLFALHLDTYEVRHWDRSGRDEFTASFIYQELRPDNYRTPSNNGKIEFIAAVAMSYSAAHAWCQQLYPDETLQQLNIIYYCLRNQRARPLRMIVRCMRCRL